VSFESPDSARDEDFGGFVSITTEQAESIVRDVIRDVLGVSEARVAAFTAETGLFGSLPELDSMAVANLLTELEDRLGIFIDDDEVDGDMLESFGALVSFAQRKITP
jgi:acyl carrier protein